MTREAVEEAVEMTEAEVAVRLMEEALANVVYRVCGAGVDMTELPVGVGDDVIRTATTAGNTYMYNRSTGGTAAGRHLISPRPYWHIWTLEAALGVALKFPSSRGVVW